MSNPTETPPPISNPDSSSQKNKNDTMMTPPSQPSNSPPTTNNHSHPQSTNQPSEPLPTNPRPEPTHRDHNRPTPPRLPFSHFSAPLPSTPLNTSPFYTHPLSTPSSPPQGYSLPNPTPSHRSRSSPGIIQAQVEGMDRSRGRRRRRVEGETQRVGFTWKRVCSKVTICVVLVGGCMGIMWGVVEGVRRLW